MANAKLAEMMESEVSQPAPKAKAPRAKVVKLQPQGKAKTAGAVEIEKVTLYLAKPVYKYIKQKALDFDRKPHDLLIEAIELLLKKDGKTISALTAR